MSRKLYKSLKAQKDQTEQVKLTLYGSLGIPLNGSRVIQVADRQGYVYVRLRDNQNEVIQAFNNKVAASYDLPVILVREGGRYVVQQFNSQRYLNNAQNSAPFLPGHGTQHSFPRGGGADITWVYGQQIMPGLVYPEAATGTNVMMEKYPLHANGRWIYTGGTGTQNILQYRPTTGSSSLMTLVYLDALTGNPGILVGSGTYFPATVTGSVYPYLPSPTTTQIPLAGVLLNTGTTVITWENIYDVRQWVHATPSGTSSGINGVNVWDEGILKGTVTTLNFVGANVDASVSGSVARIFITGSTGGTNPGGADTQVQFNDGGVFGGDADFIYDKTTQILRLHFDDGEEVNSLNIKGTSIYSDNAMAASNNAGESLALLAGAGDGSGSGGGVSANAGVGGDTGAGGSLSYTAGAGGATSGNGGGIEFAAGNSTDGNGGNISFVAGNLGGGGTSGKILLQSGDSTQKAELNTSLLTTSNKVFSFPDKTGTFELVNKNVATTSTPITLDETHDIVLVSGTTTITLPAASGYTGKVYSIKRTGTNTVTIARTGSDTIDGATSLSLTLQYQSYTVVSDGTNWYII